MGRRSAVQRLRVLLLLALLAPVPVAWGVAAASGDAFAQPKPGPSSAPVAKPAPARDGGTRYDPDNVTAISQYMETLFRAMEKYGTKDYTGAIDLTKKAIQLNPRNPLGPYLLGEEYLATGNLGEAEAAFLQAQELSDSKNPALRAKVLFAVADLYERQRKLDKALAAWKAYEEHAGKFPDAGSFPASAAGRIKAIEKYNELESKYVAVRERIAAEKDAGLEGSVSSPPKK
jgi:tetratricopeptide (TPR) repeat protein